jgi:hypothetical protein
VTFPWKRLIDYAILAVCAVAFALVLRGQDASPKNICGINKINTNAVLDLVQVNCVDYDALRAIIPEIAWPAGNSTQVLVHLRDGDVVRITVDGETKYAEPVKDSWGRMIALVAFNGIDHTHLSIKVLKEVSGQ